MTFSNLKYKTFEKTNVNLQATKELEDEFTTFLRDLGAQSNPVQPAAFVREYGNGECEISGRQNDTDEEVEVDF